MRKITFILIGIVLLTISSSSPELLAQRRLGLVFTDRKIEILKKDIKTDSRKNDNYKKVVSVASKTMREDLPYDKLEYLALKYLVDKDSKSLNKIIETIRNLSKHGSLEPTDMLHRQPAWRSQLATAKANYNMAIAYDAIYPDIDKAMRDTLARCIYSVGIQPTLHDWLDPLSRHHTINSMGHNYWMACIGNCAIACMAIAREIPELTEWISAADAAISEWTDFKGDLFQNKPVTIDNGAYYESVNYANYGMSQYLLYRYAKGNFYGGDYEINDNDLKIAEYFMHTCYPVKKGKMPSLYFGDGDEYANGEMCVKLLYEMGVTDSNMLWYLSKITPHQHKEGLAEDSPLGLLISPAITDVPEIPNIDNAISYSANGWVSMRDSWKNNATMLGVKCGHTWNHAHADAGSFILYHNGFPVIKDAGNCWYPNEQYRKYFFQSQAHNVLMFDGKAQPVEHQYQGSYCDGKISEVTQGAGIKYVVADATGPTSKYFLRNLRSFLWVDNVILVIDDARTFDYGEFSYTLHPAMETRKDGIDLLIENGDSYVAIRPISPEYLTESDFEHDFPFNLKHQRQEAPKAKNLSENESYFTITNPQKCNDVKFITAIILPDSLGHRPEVTRLDMVDGCGVRIDCGELVTDVYVNSRADGHVMHRNSCHTLGKFDTDAYILAYSYCKNESDNKEAITRWFMAYGSYLRDMEIGKSLFDSYTKQTCIGKVED